VGLRGRAVGCVGEHAVAKPGQCRWRVSANRSVCGAP
jgi:hypothetical protein